MNPSFSLTVVPLIDKMTTTITIEEIAAIVTLLLIFLMMSALVFSYIKKHFTRKGRNNQALQILMKYDNHPLTPFTDVKAKPELSVYTSGMIIPYLAKQYWHNNISYPNIRHVKGHELGINPFKTYHVGDTYILATSLITLLKVIEKRKLIVKEVCFGFGTVTTNSPLKTAKYFQSWCRSVNDNTKIINAWT